MTKKQTANKPMVTRLHKPTYQLKVQKGIRFYKPVLKALDKLPKGTANAYVEQAVVKKLVDDKIIKCTCEVAPNKNYNLINPACPIHGKGGEWWLKDILTEIYPERMNKSTHLA